MKTLTLAVVCTAFCCVLTYIEFEEPDYDNIVYGGVLRWPIPNPSTQDSDVSKAVQVAMAFLEAQSSQPLQASNGTSVSYKVTGLQKMKLVYTHNDWRALLVDKITDNNTQQPMSSLIVLGFNYAFKITIATAHSISNHDFIITMYPQSEFHIFAHVSENGNCHVDSNSSSSGHQNAKNPNRCAIYDGVKSETFPSRSFTPRIDSLQGETCERRSNDLIGRFQNGEASSQCVMKSKLLFNVTLMTFNVWNFNSRPKRGDVNYIDRIKRLGKAITAYQPDVIAFQEVRFEKKKGGSLGPNQVKHLADMLKHYQFVYQPAQMQPNSLSDGRTEEGVAIFSRYPIISHHYLKLFRNHSNSADRHQRVCQHAQILLPNQEKIHVFNTHLSLSHEAREQSVVQIWDYMKQFKGPVILMGDLNAEPEENAIKFFHQKTSLLDAWWHLHGNTDKGFTYSAIDKHFTKRIDYIFVNKQHNLHIIDAQALDDGQKGSKAASDHIPVVARLGFS